MTISTDHNARTQQSGGSSPVKKRVFSGVQPTGNIHLGNYLGAIRNWAGAQAQFDNIFCIVDLHAITLPIDPKELHSTTRKLAALYLACGLDTRYCKLFVQSHVHEHAEMSWIMECFAPMGWLNRMTQFKTKADENPETVGTGLYCYPVLMACDILLYQTPCVCAAGNLSQYFLYMLVKRYGMSRMNKQQVFTIPEGQI